jgi:hypothetical protein
MATRKNNQRNRKTLKKQRGGAFSASELANIHNMKTRFLEIKKAKDFADKSYDTEVVRRQYIRDTLKSIEGLSKDEKEKEIQKMQRKFTEEAAFWITRINFNNPKNAAKPEYKGIIMRKTIIKSIPKKLEESNPIVEISGKKVDKLPKNWKSTNDEIIKQATFSKDLLDGKVGKFKLNKDLIKEGATVLIINDPYTSKVLIVGIFKEYSEKDKKQNEDAQYTSEKMWKEAGILLD